MNTPQKIFLVAIIVVLLAHILDTWSTIVLISRGIGHEANPLQQSVYTDPWGTCLRNIPLVVFPYIVLYALAKSYWPDKNFRRILYAGIALLTFVRFYPVINNVLLLVAGINLPLPPFVPLIWQFYMKFFGG